MRANHFPPGVPIQQLNVAYSFRFWSWVEVKKYVLKKGPKKLWEWWRWRDAQNYSSSDLRMTYCCSVVSKMKIIFMCETLMEELACVVFCVNASKTMALTQWSSATTMFDLDESGGNCCKRQRCWRQMVGVYFVSWGKWRVNRGHHISFTCCLKGLLCPPKNFLWHNNSSRSLT